MAKQEEAARMQTEETAEVSGLERLLGIVDLPAAEAGEKDSPSAKMSQALNILVHSVVGRGEKVDYVDRVLVDSVIAELDERISRQVDEILHHKAFQSMESAWRSLEFLVSRTNFRQNIKLEILDVTKEELAEDFEQNGDVVESGLYNLIYEKGLATPGATPVAALVSDYEFENTTEDLLLLQDLSKVAAASHAPFLGSVGAKFLGLDSLGKLPNLTNIADDIKDDPRFAKWRSFRETEDSRYVGLTLNEVLLRTPYSSEERRGAKTFDYNENVADDPEKYLWGKASFAMATRLAGNFADFGWCVNIRGKESGGLVDDLNVHNYEAAGSFVTKPPTRIIISDPKEFELSEKMGLIPLVPYENESYAVFFSANSVHQPQVFDDDEATANEKLSSRLPYLFLVSRLAHYLRVIQRDAIGSVREAKDLELRLNEWIKKLVTLDPSPPEEVRKKYPLAGAHVSVTPNPANPGWYRVEMSVRPHFQLEGLDISLSLVSNLPESV